MQAHIRGEFDVQVDGQYRWDEDKVCEIDVYPIRLNQDGNHETDTLVTLASVRVPTGDYSDDMWYYVPQVYSTDLLEKLPEQIKKGVEEAVAKALEVHNSIPRTQKYDVGTTVFIKEHRFPGDIEAHTLDGGYIINMANSGELGEFSESELEDYNQELWHRP